MIIQIDKNENKIYDESINEIREIYTIESYTFKQKRTIC